MKKLSAEEYLNQVQELDTFINQELERIAEMKSSASSTGAIDYSKDKVQTSPTNMLERKVVNYVDLEETINQRIDQFVDAKEQVIAQIRGLHNDTYCKILFKVYVQYKSLKQVTAEMGVTYNTVQNNHRKALELFEERYPDLHYFNY